MHFRLLVTMNQSRAKTSSQAREVVFRELGSDPDFSGDNGICDWFVIGGRWSGDLTNVQLSQAKLKALGKEFEKKHGWYINSENSEEDRRRQYATLFKKYFPSFKGEIPAWRDTYKHEGFDDDAQILTDKLYDAVLKQYEVNLGVVEKEYDGYKWKEHYYKDLDGDTISRDMVGKKWVVVVDYHS